MQVEEGDEVLFWDPLNVWFRVTWKGSATRLTLQDTVDHSLPIKCLCPEAQVEFDTAEGLVRAKRKRVGKREDKSLFGLANIGGEQMPAHVEMRDSVEHTVTVVPIRAPTFALREQLFTIPEGDFKPFF